LPIEVALHIFVFLDPKSLLVLGWTCRALVDATSNSDVWFRLNQQLLQRSLDDKSAPRLAGLQMDTPIHRTGRKKLSTTNRPRGIDWKQEFHSRTATYSLQECNLSSGITWSVQTMSNDVMISSSSTGMLHVLKRETDSKLKLQKSIQFESKPRANWALGEPCKVGVLDDAIATGCWGYSLYLLNVETSQLLKVGDLESTATALKPISTNLVAIGSAGSDAKLTIFDIRSHSPIVQSFPMESTVLCLETSDDSVYCGGRFKNVCKIDLKTGKPSAVEFCASQVYSMHLVKSSKPRLLTGRGRCRGSGGCIDVWDPTTMKLVESIDTTQTVNFIRGNGKHNDDSKIAYGSIYGHVSLVDADVRPLGVLIRDSNGSFTDATFFKDGSIAIGHFGGVGVLSPQPGWSHVVENEAFGKWWPSSNLCIKPIAIPHVPETHPPLFRRDPPREPNWLTSMSNSLSWLRF